jgi:hypothetical protein
MMLEGSLVKWANQSVIMLRRSTSPTSDWLL